MDEEPLYRGEPKGLVAGAIVVTLVVTLAVALGIQWLSDVAYGAGLWPVGALLRVAMWVVVGSWFFTLFRLLREMSGRR